MQEDLSETEGAGDREERIAACRRRFRESGLPLLDEDFSASTNVFNRAAPLFALVFLGEMLGAIQLEWSLLANLAALLGGLAILLGAWMVVNNLRGRPLMAVPEDVGGAELTAFVLVPALLPLIFGGQVQSAVVTAVANLLLLMLVYAFLGYGLGSILVWVARRLWMQLASSLTLLARAVPLLLIFALLAFMSTEMWQVFSLIPDGNFVAIVVLFLALGTGFLVARLPREVRALEAEVGAGDTEPLGTRQRRNVALVLFTSQAVQVLAVSLLVALFFVVFGLLAITGEVRDAWIGESGKVLVGFDLFGEHFDLTWDLVKVAAGLAAFTGLYFAISMLTDSTYREEFLEEVTAELRSTFAVREEYLQLRSAGTPGG